jgi:hypothetical protein
MLTFKVAELLRTFWLPSFVFVALCSRCWDDHMYQCFFFKTTFVLETHSFVAMVKQMRSKEIRRPPILFYLEHNLETRARNIILCGGLLRLWETPATFARKSVHLDPVLRSTFINRHYCRQT